MPWNTLFAVANAVALIAWFILILAPRPKAVVEGLRLLVVGGLCTLYVVLLGTALTMGLGEASGAKPDFSTIAGIRSIFATDGGVVIGWIHYLAFDLVAGLWIARDADGRGIGRFIQAPVLALTFVAGPAGMLCHLLLCNIVPRYRAKG